MPTPSSRPVPGPQPSRLAVWSRIGHWPVFIFLLTGYFLWTLYGACKTYTGNFDTGTVSLMAVNIAYHHDRPLFWYGQRYFGALESYVAACMLRLFGFSETVMTLSPICFSLVWLGATGLLFRELGGRWCGVLAMVGGVVSGYFPYFYSFGLTGGYAAVMALGTLALCLGVRVYRRDLEGRAFWLHLLGIGAFAGLGLWTHFLVAPYLLTTGVVLAAHLVRRRFAFRLLPGYAMGALVAAAGLVPSLWAARVSMGSDMISRFYWTPEHLGKSLDTLWRGNFAQMFHWNFADRVWGMPNALVAALAWLAWMLLGVALLGTRHLGRRTGRGWLVWVPWAYMACFFGLYLPHQMAVIPAPRYVLGPWTMGWSLMFAYGLPFLWRRRGWRYPGLLLAVALAGYQLAGDLGFVRAGAPEKRARLAQAGQILSFCREHGIRSAVLVGSDLFGFEGQVLSTLSKNEIRFVHMGNERYQGNAQAVEADPDYAILCPLGDGGYLAAALDLAGVDFSRQDLGGVSVFHTLRPRPRTDREIAAEEMRVRATGQVLGAGEALLDRDLSTAVGWRGPSGGMLEVDFGRTRPLGGLWLFPGHMDREGVGEGLPVRFEVWTAGPDRNFRKILPARDHLDTTYVLADHVYVTGFFGRFDLRLDGVACRYLQLRFPGRQRVALAEIVAFGPGELPRSTLDEDVARVAGILERAGVAFAYTDRYLAARLRPILGPDRVFARFNPRHYGRNRSRLLVVDRSSALVVDRAVADSTQRLLAKVFRGESIAWRQDTGRYSVFGFRDLPRPLGAYPLVYFNGHLPLVIGDFDDLAAFDLKGTRVGYFRPDSGAASGFYHDGWTDGTGVLTRLDFETGGQATMLLLVTHGWMPNGGDPVANGLEVRVDGRRLTLVRREGKVYVYRLPPGLERLETIEIRSRTFVPPTRDRRRLGVDVAYVLVL